MLKVSEKVLASTVIRSTIETAEVWKRKKAEQEANRQFDIDDADVEPGHHQDNRVQDPNTDEIGTFKRIVFSSRLPPLTIKSLELHAMEPELDPAFQNLTGKFSQALMRILQIPIQDNGNQRITLAPTHEVRRHYYFPLSNWVSLTLPKSLNRSHHINLSKFITLPLWTGVGRRTLSVPTLHFIIGLDMTTPWFKSHPTTTNTFLFNWSGHSKFGTLGKPSALRSFCPSMFPVFNETEAGTTRFGW